ncbi:hypothetical protein FNV43_RR17032 [Rhamnella rubrinervis]|uniref:Uncharacterized protein n=1 Tax=Rhamnella rubrinervis TaxID=2594499 RepID=A0A8K0GZX4_9ROSA|nr:hypothetical protein FNV43_RR17032 [Rhamnella rubrinervis]
MTDHATRYDVNEDAAMGGDFEAHDLHMTAMEDDSEIQYITPSKVIHCEPRIKKHVGQLKSPYVVTTEIQENLKNILSPPTDFDPKKAPLDDVEMRFFNYMTSDVILDYNVYDVLMPLNIEDRHWVLANIDLCKQHWGLRNIYAKGNRIFTYNKRI